MVKRYFVLLKIHSHHLLFYCLSTGFCMFVLSLVKKHYRLQFYMVRLNAGPGCSQLEAEEGIM